MVICLSLCSIGLLISSALVASLNETLASVGLIGSACALCAAWAIEKGLRGFLG